MKTLNDYICQTCSRVEEHYSDTMTMDCICGGEMQRAMPNPTIRLEGITGAFPAAYDKWAKVREERHRIASRRNS